MLGLLDLVGLGWVAERWLGMARLARVEVFAADEIVHVMNRTVRRCFLLLKWGQESIVRSTLRAIWLLTPDPISKAATVADALS